MLNKLLSVFIFFLYLDTNNFSLADFPIVYDLNDAIALSESTNQPMVLVFGAKWCPYCVELKDDIDKGNYAKELDNRIVCYIDIDKHKDLKKEYDVKTLPDTRYLIDNKEISQLIGYGESKFRGWIKNVEQK